MSFYKPLITLRETLKRYQWLKTIAFGGLLFVPFIVLGQMGSVNYQMISDSINFGGGRSDSSNYQLDDTLGEVATGSSSSTNYELQAGFQQVDTYPIALSTSGNVNMPALGGISTNISSAELLATVETRNPTGYELSVKVTTDPAMKSASSSFSDYSPVGLVPDMSFDLGSGEDGFGFSVEGSNVSSRFLDNGSACGVGSSNSSNSCWDGFSTGDKLIAEKATPTEVGGDDTTLVLRAGIGPEVIKEPGSYQATVEITAVSL